MAIIEKDAKRIFRITELSKQIPNIDTIVDQANSVLENSDIIVKEKITISLIESSRTLRTIYEKYIDPKTPSKECPKILLALQQALDAYQKQKSIVADYIEQNENNTLVAKRSYLDYIKNIPEAISYIHQHGYGDKLSVINISDTTFLQGLIPQLNQILTTYRITILQARRRGYDFLAEERRETFYILHEKLMDFIIEGIFGEAIPDGVSQVGILASSSFTDEKSYTIALNWLLEDTVYEYEIDRELNEIIFYHDKRGNGLNAYLHNWNQFLKKVSRVLLTRENYDQAMLNDYIIVGEHINYEEHFRMRYEMQQNPTQRR